SLSRTRSPPRRLRSVDAVVCSATTGLRRPEVERIGVDDDLAPARREDADECPDRGHGGLAARPALNEEALGAARAVPLPDRSELRAVDVAHGRADDLVPEVLAATELGVGSGDPLAVDTPERL